MTLFVLLERFWPIMVGFLSAGGSWYWANKKTVTGKRLENLESESKELLNLKTIVGMIQIDLQNELLKKNDTIEELSKVIVELNRKIETLSMQIRELNKKINSTDEHCVDVKELALGCKLRSPGDVCQVLQHFAKTKLIKNDKSPKPV